jgi:hypothetical protein
MLGMQSRIGPGAVHGVVDLMRLLQDLDLAPFYQQFFLDAAECTINVTFAASQFFRGGNTPRTRASIAERLLDFDQHAIALANDYPDDRWDDATQGRLLEIGFLRHEFLPQVGDGFGVVPPPPG